MPAVLGLSGYSYLRQRLLPVLLRLTRHVLDRYLAAGSITIAWSLVVLAVLPDSPASAHRWFSPAEREILLRRMRGNVAGADVRIIKREQVLEAFKDVKVWLMGAMGAAIYVCNGGVTAFGSLIIKVCALSSPSYGYG